MVAPIVCGIVIELICLKPIFKSGVSFTKPAVEITEREVRDTSDCPGPVSLSHSIGILFLVEFHRVLNSCEGLLRSNAMHMAGEVLPGCFMNQADNTAVCIDSHETRAYRNNNTHMLSFGFIKPGFTARYRKGVLELQGCEQSFGASQQCEDSLSKEPKPGKLASDPSDSYSICFGQRILPFRKRLQCGTQTGLCCFIDKGL